MVLNGFVWSWLVCFQQCLGQLLLPAGLRKHWSFTLAGIYNYLKNRIHLHLADKWLAVFLWDNRDSCLDCLLAASFALTFTSISGIQSVSEGFCGRISRPCFSISLALSLSQSLYQLQSNRIRFRRVSQQLFVLKILLSFTSGLDLQNRIATKQTTHYGIYSKWFDHGCSISPQN